MMIPPAISLTQSAEPQKGIDKNAFCIMLSQSIMDSWRMLPYSGATKLQYRLYCSGTHYVASISTPDKNDLLFWREPRSGKHAILVPQNEVTVISDKQIKVGGTTYGLISSWVTGPPAID